MRMIHPSERPMVAQCENLGGEQQVPILVHVQRAQPLQIGDERGKAGELGVGQVQLLRWG